MNDKRPTRDEEDPVSDCCGASAFLAEGLLDYEICPACGEHCEWVRPGDDEATESGFDDGGRP